MNTENVGFKPYYKWIIFNIRKRISNNWEYDLEVLNLIING